MGICLLILFIVILILILQGDYGKKMGGSYFLNEDDPNSVTYDDVDRLLTDLEFKHEEISKRSNDIVSPYPKYLNRIATMSSNNAVMSNLSPIGRANEKNRLSNDIQRSANLTDLERKDLMGKLRSHT